MPPSWPHGRHLRNAKRQVGSTPRLPRRLEVLAQPERVVDRGVDVARGDRVADAEQAIAPVGISLHRLQPAVALCLVVDYPPTTRKQPDTEIRSHHQANSVYIN